MYERIRAATRARLDAATSAWNETRAARDRAVQDGVEAGGRRDRAELAESDARARATTAGDTVDARRLEGTTAGEELDRAQRRLEGAQRRLDDFRARPATPFDVQADLDLEEQGLLAAEAAAGSDLVGAADTARRAGEDLDAATEEQTLADEALVLAGTELADARAAVTAGAERLVQTGAAHDESGRLRDRLTDRLSSLDAREAVLADAATDEDALAAAADRDLADTADLRAARSAHRGERRALLASRATVLAPLDGSADDLTALTTRVRATDAAAADVVPAAVSAELDALATAARVARHRLPTLRTDAPVPERLDTLAAALREAGAPLVGVPNRADALAELVTWAERLDGIAGVHRAVAAALTGPDAAVAQIDARTAEVDDAIADHVAARTPVTSRLLGDVTAPGPLVLAPVRLETRWSGTRLQIRIYPDEIGVDLHDPRLTADEVAHGRQYWASADRATAWTELTARMPAPRAAWVARSTASGADPDVRSTPMPAPPGVRLLPNRFAAVAFSGGVPVPLGADGRRTVWGAPVTVDDAAIERSWYLPEDTPDDERITGPSPWTVEFGAALAAGMALETDVPEDAPPIELLVVVGVAAGDPGLAGLLGAHAYGAGCEILADAVPTNNSDGLRSGMARRRVEDVAAELTDPSVNREPGPAGTALARLLGVEPAELAFLPGAGAERGAGLDAARRLVAAGAGGTLRDLLGPDAGAAVASLEPDGPSPALRVGRQPYGVLPVTAPGRWVAAVGETGPVAGDLPAAWAGRAGLAVDADEPATMLPATVAPRVVVEDDDDSWDAVLAETGRSLDWTDPTGVTVPVAVGPGATGGDQTMADRVAAAARAAVPDGDRPAIDTALSELTAVPAAGRVLGGVLDAVAHRVDPWITAACTARLDTLRAEHGTAGYGAYGWTTGVAPRPGPRTHGRLLAPSLAQAATGAVLRSGFLDGRGHAWAQRIAAASAALDKARAGADPAALAAAEQAYTAAVDGRRSLAPLGDDEAAVPLAVDLSGRRVRDARRMWAAVLAGQRLGAVLGHRFERDLADSGQQAHLAAFRAVSRLRTGGPLDDLIDRRDTARRTADDAHGPYDEAVKALDAAGTALTDAQGDLARTEIGLADAVVARDAFPATPATPVDADPGVVAALADLDRVRRDNPYPPPDDTGIPVIIDPNEPPPVVDQALIDQWLADMAAAAAVVGEARAAVLGARERQDRMRAALVTAVTDAEREVGRATAARDDASARLTDAKSAVAGPKTTYEKAVADLEDATRAVAAGLRQALAVAGTATTLGAMVDGWDLHERLRTATGESPPRWDHDTIPFPADDTQVRPERLGLPVVGTPGYTAVLAVLRRLAELVDALADLLTAESVHQLVAGNPERSGAALEPAAGGQVPETFEVVRTPRPGAEATHRVLVAWDPEAPPRWSGPAGVEALLDPALAAWAGRRIPDPAGVTVRVLGPGSAQAIEFDLGALGLDPLGWVRLAAEPGELGRRIAAVAAARGLAGPLRVVEDDDPLRTTPADVLAAAAAVGKLLDGSRALGPDDVAAPGAAPTALSVPDLAARVAAAEDAVRTLLTDMDAVAAGAGTDPEAVLRRASAVGIAEAAPVDGPDVADVRTRAAAAAARLRARVGDDAFVPDGGDPAGTHRRALARAEALCGRRLPLLGPVVLPAAVRGDLDDGVDPGAGEAVRGWLDDRARVRPAVEALCALADVGEVLVEAEPLEVVGVRLTADGGEHPLDPPRAPSLGLAVLRSGEPLPERSTGLVVDAWTETVPGDGYTAGLAFHHGPPTPDAPQALLVAVAPDTSATAWDLDTLVDVLRSTVALATERVVAPALLGGTVTLEVAP